MHTGYIVETIEDTTRGNAPLVKRKWNDDLDELLEYIEGWIGSDDGISESIPNNEKEFEIEVEHLIFTITKVEYR